MVSYQLYNCELEIREFYKKELEELLKRILIYKSPELYLEIARLFDEMNKAIDAEEAKLLKRAV